jgi:hypothetical protein
MPDVLKAMREFRFLSDKRRGAGLTQEEENHWKELKVLLRVDGVAQSEAEPEAPPARPAEPTIDPGAWLNDPKPATAPEAQEQAGTPSSFDFQAQPQWAEDGTYYPPGFDPAAGCWTDSAFEQAYAQGCIWDAATQAWVSLFPAEAEQEAPTALMAEAGQEDEPLPDEEPELAPAEPSILEPDFPAPPLEFQPTPSGVPIDFWEPPTEAAPSPEPALSTGPKPPAAGLAFTQGWEDPPAPAESGAPPTAKPIDDVPLEEFEDIPLEEIDDIEPMEAGIGAFSGTPAAPPSSNGHSRLPGLPTPVPFLFGQKTLPPPLPSAPRQATQPFCLPVTYGEMEASPPAKSPSPSAPLAPAPRGLTPLPFSTAPGPHRVIVHTLEGQVKRGLLRQASLDGEQIELEIIAGQPPERLATQRLKAVFFLLAPGTKPSAAQGQKLRVTFNDERQVAGFAPNYHPTDKGFFLFPADPRTNTERIYVYRAAVKSITAG